MNRNTFKISCIGYKKKVYPIEAQEMKLGLLGGLHPETSWPGAWDPTGELDGSEPPVPLGGSASLCLCLCLPLPLSLSLSSFPCLTMRREKEDVHLWECPLNVQALVLLNSRLSCKKSDYPTGLYLPQVSIRCLVINGLGSGGH